MSTYKDRQGVWGVYDYDVGAYVLTVTADITEAAKKASQQGFGHVLFWPYDMGLTDAISWWNEEQKNMDLSDSIIHFFYDHVRFTRPICKETDVDEWVQFDHTAVGKICPDCQDKLGRKIQ